MATRGPKPKPKAINDLKGDPGKRRRYQKEIEAPEGFPEMPDYPAFDEAAQDEWHYVCNMLNEMQMLSVADKGMIENHCISYSRWRKAVEEIMTGDGAVIINGKDNYKANSPWCNEANQMQKFTNDFYKSFGLTPVSRASLSIKQDKKKDKKTDIGKFMKAVS